MGIAILASPSAWAKWASCVAMPISLGNGVGGVRSLSTESMSPSLGETPYVRSRGALGAGCWVLRRFQLHLVCRRRLKDRSYAVLQPRGWTVAHLAVQGSCRALRCIAVLCSVVWCGAVRCDVVHGIVPWRAVRCAVPCRGVVWCGVVPWFGLQCSVLKALLPNGIGWDVLHTGNAKWEGCVCERALRVVCGSPAAQGRRSLQCRAAAV